MSDTHWEGCWVSHHACAQRRIDELGMELADMTEERNHRLGIACTRHDLVHSLACGHCFHEMTAEMDAALNLLAVIHRDGGHHTGDVGFTQSCDDARAAWYALMTMIEAADHQKELLAHLFALVEGECPALLDDDRGGNSQLGIEIEDALKEKP